MPTQYRLTFADELVYELEFVKTEVPDAWIRGVVYRVHGERRDPEPMQHEDGRPMEFHAPTSAPASKSHGTQERPPSWPWRLVVPSPEGQSSADGYELRESTGWYSPSRGSA